MEEKCLWGDALCESSEDNYGVNTNTNTATASPAFGDTADTAIWREIAMLRSTVTGILEATVETNIEDAEDAAAQIEERSNEMLEGDTIEFCALTGKEFGRGRIRVSVWVLTGSAYKTILEDVKAARAKWLEDDLD